MPLVFDPDGAAIPALTLTAAKRQAIASKVAAFLNGQSRLNPWVYIAFDAAGRHCEVYLKRDASADGFAEAWVMVGQADFDVLVRQ